MAKYVLFVIVLIQDSLEIGKHTFICRAPDNQYQCDNTYRANIYFL